MTTRGALLIDDDGSVYFVPEDVLEECRLTADEVDVINQQLAGDAEVEGFVDPSVVRMWTATFDIGKAIGAGVDQNQDEPDAREAQKQWKMADMTVERSGTSLRPSRRRF